MSDEEEIKCDECWGQGSEPCWNCGGSGEEDLGDGEVEECVECEGSGCTECPECDGIGVLW